jgi:hypothetical protein
MDRNAGLLLFLNGVNCIYSATSSPASIAMATSSPAFIAIPTSFFDGEMPPMIMNLVADYLPPGRAQLVKWRFHTSTTPFEPQETAKLLALEDDTEGLQYVMCHHKPIDVAGVVAFAIRFGHKSELISDLIKAADVSSDVLLCAAAGGGNHELVAASLQNGATTANEALVEAATAGSLPVVTTLLKTGLITQFKKAIVAAGNYGHLEVVKKTDSMPLMEIAYLQTKDTYPHDVRRTVEHAAKHGSLNVLDWAKSFGVAEFGRAYVAAAKAGTLSSLIHMADWPKLRGYVGNAFVQAARYGKHKIMATVFEHLLKAFATDVPPFEDTDSLSVLYSDEISDDGDANKLAIDPTTHDKAFWWKTIDDPTATSPLHGPQSYLQSALFVATCQGHAHTARKALSLGAMPHWKILARSVVHNSRIMKVLMIHDLDDMTYRQTVAAVHVEGRLAAQLDTLIRAATTVEQKKYLLQELLTCDHTNAVRRFFEPYVGAVDIPSWLPACINMLYARAEELCYRSLYPETTGRAIVAYARLAQGFTDPVPKPIHLSFMIAVLRGQEDIMALCRDALIDTERDGIVVVGLVHLITHLATQRLSVENQRTIIHAVNGLASLCKRRVVGVDV